MVVGVLGPGSNAHGPNEVNFKFGNIKVFAYSYDKKIDLLFSLNTHEYSKTSR